MEGILRPGSVVVGVDTSSAAMTALDWAAQYAQAVRAPIHLVHGFSHDRPDLGFGMGADAEALLAAGDRVLSRAVNRIQLRDKMIQVTTSHCDGYPSAALVRASADARIVVVGSQGDSLLHLSSLGETAHQVAIHAASPVAVIRKDSGLESAFNRVTVGVDRSDDSRAALEWAFDEAERTDSEVLAVHAWQPHDAKDPSLGHADWASYTEMCRNHIEGAIAAQQARHPGVKVITEIFQGNPTRALLTESHSSDTVVVGARGTGGFPGLHMGRVAGDVLRHAASPVVIVR